MELFQKSMNILFAQLGEASDDNSIERFIAFHGALHGTTQLHEANCWTASQAGFLCEALLLDAAWAPVVDELNARLHHTV